MLRTTRIKRTASIILSLVMLLSVATFNNSVNVNAAVQEGLSDLTRMVAEEGIVMLENPNYTGSGQNSIGKVLPLNNGVKIAMFGRVQDYYYAGGTGSGEAPRNAPYRVSIADGLRSNPNVVVDETMTPIYREYTRQNPFVSNSGWQSNPSGVTWGQAEMPLSATQVEAARQNSDAAVVFIGRTAGEDHELEDKPGSYQLTELELDMIRKVYAVYDRVVILMNVSQVLDSKFIDEFKDKAAFVYVWQGGMEGGNAVADVITGDISPSGKLTSTIVRNVGAYNPGLYPNFPNHSNSNEDNSYLPLNNGSSLWYSIAYSEDIYVGYRFFETFKPNEVLYPFGFGLSYTTFDTTVTNITSKGGEIKDDTITVNVNVKNTGAVKGKEVVQVYYGAPQGVLGNPVKELAAFVKTGVLAPGESQNIALTFKAKDMASYDDSGVTGNKSAYVLEAGNYNIYVGTDVRSSTLAYTYNVPTLTVTEQCTEAVAPVKDNVGLNLASGVSRNEDLSFDRVKPEPDGSGGFNITRQTVPVRTKDTVDQALADLPSVPQLPQIPKDGKTLLDVYNGNITMEEFVGRFTDRELVEITMGEGSKDKITPGTAGVFGRVTENLRAMGIPLMNAADGPAGIRGTSAVPPTSALPTGTTCASSWNLELMQKMFEYVGKELISTYIDTLLGPGIEVMRHPFGGRHFEYYSEDPLLAGMMAAANTRGIQSQGPTPTAKHMATNNHEFWRRQINVKISERAFREIYLKPFEIAVKDADLRAIMSSYNPINGTNSATSYDLIHTILRKEWGFKGIVMSDWWPHLTSDRGFYTTSRTDGNNGAAMVRAHHDLYMPKNDNDVTNNLGGMNTLTELQAGRLTRGELQRVAMNICNYAMTTPAFAREHGIPYQGGAWYNPGERWFQVAKDGASEHDPFVTGITIGGNPIRSDLFYPLRLEYRAFYNGVGEYPIVHATPDTGTTLTITQATPQNPVATITATAGREERNYKIIFQTADGLEPLTDGADYAYLSEIRVNGVPLQGFVATKFDYGLGLPDLTELPNVTYTVHPDIEGKQGVSVIVSSSLLERWVRIRVVTPDQSNSYVLQFGKQPVSDNFTESPATSNIWTIHRPTNDGTNPAWTHSAAGTGTLEVTGIRGSMWQGENDLNNFFYQEAFGDWESTAYFNLNRRPTNNYETVALVATDGAGGTPNYQNYLQIKYSQDNSGSFIFEKEVSGGDPIRIGIVTNQNHTSVYLRLKKIGDTYSGYYSTNGTTWTRVGTTGAKYDLPLFAFHCSTGGANPNSNRFRATFDYIDFNNSPTTDAFTVTGPISTLKLAAEEPAAMSPNIRFLASDDIGGGNHVSNASAGDYVSYNVTVPETGTYRLAARYKATNPNPIAQMSFNVLKNSEYITTYAYLTQTDGRWVTARSTNEITLEQGTYQIMVMLGTDGVELNWLKFLTVEQNVNTDALAAAIAEAEDIDLSLYAAARVNIFLPTLDEARSVLNDPINQQNVDDAITALLAAIEELNSGLLPVNIPPDKTTDITNGIRIVPFNTPWSYVNDSRFNFAAGGRTDWTSPNDVLYLGYIDLTDLAEIRVNYSNGNANASVRMSFYTLAEELGSPNKRTVNGDGKPYTVYSGGDLRLSSEAARISFTQTGSPLWENYGTCSTTGLPQADTNTHLNTYVSGGNFIDPVSTDGMKNVYLRTEGAAANIAWVEFIYYPPTRVWLEKSDTTNEVFANFSIGNDSEETLNAICVVAVYDENGNLKTIEQEPVSVDPEDKEQKTITLPMTYEYTKAFLWDADTFIPLCDNAEGTVDWFSYSEHLAFGRNVRSTDAQLPDNTLANAVDNDRTTRWAASGGGYPRWIEVDLGSECELDSLDLYWFVSGTRAYRYRVWGRTESITNWDSPYAHSKNFSTDSNYFLMADNSSNTTAAHTTNGLGGQKARYVAIEVIGTVNPTNGGSASIYSIEIAGKRGAR